MCVSGGRDRIRTIAAFRMLLAKIGAKVCYCCQPLNSQATPPWEKIDGKFWRACKCPKPVPSQSRPGSMPRSQAGSIHYQPANGLALGTRAQSSLPTFLSYFRVFFHRSRALLFASPREGFEPSLERGVLALSIICDDQRLHYYCDNCRTESFKLFSVNYF